MTASQRPEKWPTFDWGSCVAMDGYGIVHRGYLMDDVPGSIEGSGITLCHSREKRRSSYIVLGLRAAPDGASVTCIRCLIEEGET